MAGNHSLLFKVVWVPATLERAGSILRRGKQHGFGKELELAFAEVRARLSSNPLTWGDPLYATKLPGGIVCHGMEPPLNVLFAVFEERRLVFVFGLDLLPDHPLGNS
jgi:hypothetical protein